MSLVSKKKRRALRHPRLRVIMGGVPGPDLRPAIEKHLADRGSSAAAYARQTFVRLSILADPPDPDLPAGC